MKKIIALTLGLIMIMGSTAVLAEVAAEKTELCSLAAFKIKGVIPEGYTLTPTDDNDEIQAIGMLSAGEDKALIIFSIAYSEEYQGVERLNDLDEEALEIIRESFRDMDDVAFEDLETSYGTRLMKVTTDDSSFADLYTIYKGYECEFIIASKEGVTDADIKLLVDFISDMDFVPAE